MSEVMVAAVLDALLDALSADAAKRSRLAEMLAQDATGGATTEPPAAWLDAKGAAAYLGITRDALHKLTARRAVPFSQEVPGGKLYFRPVDLDRWRLESGHDAR